MQCVRTTFRPQARQCLAVVVLLLGTLPALDEGKATACQSSCVDARRPIEYGRGSLGRMLDARGVGEVSSGTRALDGGGSSNGYSSSSRVKYEGARRTGGVKE